MINFQVENLEQLLAQLKREGVTVDPKVGTYDYGKFGWIMDPEGNRIELWEPATRK
jgi:predicted enzyme related to lactoylglutathione lyase